MKQILIIVMSLFMTLNVSACSEKANEAITLSEEEDNAGGNNPTNGDTLIVSFSRHGENYAVGTISVGNTALMADYIQEVIGGTLFEIIPEIAYPNGYEETKLISLKERDEDLRPAIKNKLDSLEKYSVVFIGSPIWYGGPPMIMQTFYETYPELADKTIIPFGTHEGSGIGSCVTLLKRYFPKAVIKESLGLRGAEVRNSSTESCKVVKEWIDKIEIT